VRGSEGDFEKEIVRELVDEETLAVKGIGIHELSMVL
jgi:hypothetical protein